ncbi:MAG: TIGR00282 family metallophosphoesterase [Candidatus Cloacimonetes bacterium]|nr:TIGR00282 family metallophosphoesterase [Candidatus Cloacimonadota bacterium]
MKILFFGDIYGKAGRQTVFSSLPQLKEQYQPDFIIANGENLADGKGLTEKTAHPIFTAGIDVLTGGNHLWDRADSLEYIKNQSHIVKPMNYPLSTPGNSYCILEKEGMKLGIISLCGQIYMPPCDNPFTTLQSFLAKHDPQIPLLLDFHAESTSEKRALAWFADGKISAFLGTHTHIQTADEEIMPQGMAYITDVGMTGSHDSVIGVQKEIIVQKMLMCVPSPYKSSDHGLQVNAVICEISSKTGLATSITRIREHVSLAV